MPSIDTIIATAANEPGLGEAAGPLVHEAAALMASTPGGLSDFLDRFRRAGMGATVATWLGRADGQILTAGQVEEVLGSLPVTDIAGRTGLSRDAAGTALGQIIPKLAGHLTPGGVVAAGVPAALAGLLAGRTVMAAATAAGQDENRGIGGWGYSMLACLLGIGVIAWLMQPPGAPAPKVEAPPAKVEAVAPKIEVPAPTMPATLDITNANGTVTVAGAVHDEATRASIMDLLRSVFGADKVKGELTIDPARQAPPWMSGLRAALEAMKIPGLHAVFDGAKLTLEGFASLAGRDQVLAALSAALGSGISLSGHLLDKIAELVANSSTTTISALTGLSPGFTPEALLNILNMHIINFDSGSFAIPETAEPVLAQAAARLKELPPGTKVEIGGYTDNTGDAAGNLQLSAQRAGSVRDFLTKSGVDANILTAKGFGADNPVGSNDTPEGRFRNRRIEYHLAPP